MHLRSSRFALSLMGFCLIVILGLVSLTYVAALPFPGDDNSNSSSELVRRESWYYEARIVYDHEDHPLSQDSPETIQRLISNHIQGQLKGHVKFIFASAGVPYFEDNKIEFSVEWMVVGGRTFTTRGAVQYMGADPNTGFSEYEVKVRTPGRREGRITWDDPGSIRKRTSRVMAAAQKELEAQLQQFIGEPDQLGLTYVPKDGLPDLQNGASFTVHWNDESTTQGNLIYDRNDKSLFKVKLNAIPPRTPQHSQG